MTLSERIIVSAYTGVLMCDFHEVHKYIERKLGRPVWTHELASHDVWDEIKKATKSDFLALCRMEPKQDPDQTRANEEEFCSYVKTLPVETYISIFKKMYADMKKYHPIELKSLQEHEKS